MSRNQNYLTVATNVFDGGLYPIPSQIIPGLEIIKNEERSMSGRMHVDIIDNKENLQIVFDVLSEPELRAVMQAFGIKTISPDGIAVEYFNTNLSNNLSNMVRRTMYVRDFTFDPLIVEDGIRWRNVTIQLAEI